LKYPIANRGGGGGGGSGGGFQPLKKHRIPVTGILPITFHRHRKAPGT